MTMNYQPSHDVDQHDFTKDLAFGEAGEQIIRDFLEALSQGSFEVKYDRFRNGKMVIEIEQNPRHNGWKPSGINVTEAHWWVYMYSPETFVVTTVDRLKRYIDVNKKCLSVVPLAEHSDNPASGYLLPSAFVFDLLTEEMYDGK